MINLDFYFEDYKTAECNIYELIDYSRFDGIVLDTVGLMNSTNKALSVGIYEKNKEA